MNEELLIREYYFIRVKTCQNYILTRYLEFKDHRLVMNTGCFYNVFSISDPDIQYKPIVTFPHQCDKIVHVKYPETEEDKCFR